jgi:hypothetical protein
VKVCRGLVQGNLAALDHRHPLAVVHLQLLRSLAQTHENNEHPAKHADHEHRCEQFRRHLHSNPLTGRLD